MLYSIILFLIGFVFNVLHESNMHRKTFASIGKWFSPRNPVEMKKKFRFLPFVWNFYHFSEWIALVFYYSAFYIAYVREINNWLSGYFAIGLFIAFIAFILNEILYGIYGEKK